MSFRIKPDRGLSSLMPFPKPVLLGSGLQLSCSCRSSAPVWLKVCRLPDWILYLLLLGLLTSCQPDKVLGRFNSEKPTNQNSETNNTKIVKENNVSQTLNNKPYRIQQDTTTLPPILKEGGFGEQMNAWHGKILLVKFYPGQSQPEFRFYYQNTLYRDTNSNNIQDESDQGFFNPGSTVKVGIAALALERLHQLGLGRESQYRIGGTSTWYRIDEDIRHALVISDNDATNRLILWLGFEHINQSLKNKGLAHLVIDRLMLNEGTLIESPVFELQFQNKVIHQSKKSVSVKSTCYEVDHQVGNCATASDLAGVLMRVVQPEYFSAEESFNLSQSDRTWLQTMMAHTPRQEGFDYADDYCRFLIGLEQEFSKNKGRMLSKCGVALFSNTFVDSSFIETDSGDKFYTVFSVTPPKSTPEKEIFQWMNKVAIFVLPRLP